MGYMRPSLNLRMRSKENMEMGFNPFASESSMCFLMLAAKDHCRIHGLKSFEPDHPQLIYSGSGSIGATFLKA